MAQIYPAFVIQWRFSVFYKGVARLFDIWRYLDWFGSHHAISFSSNLFTDLHHSKASKIRLFDPTAPCVIRPFSCAASTFRRWKHRTVSLLHFCLAQWRPWSYVGEDWFPDPQNNINNTYTLGAFGRYVIKMSQRRKFWLNLVSLLVLWEDIPNIKHLCGNLKTEVSKQRFEELLESEMVHFARALRPHPVSLPRFSFISLFIMLYLNTFERFSVRPSSHCFFCAFAFFTDVRKSANVVSALMEDMEAEAYNS